VVLSFGQLPIHRPIQLYSRQLTVSPGTTHSFLLDYSCASDGDIVMDINQPSFDDVVGGAFLYVSAGPSKGPYAPYPNPDDKSTFQWTTWNNFLAPKPGVAIPNGAGKQYYVLVDCPFEESCGYELASQLTPKNMELDLKKYSKGSSKPLPRIARRSKVDPPEQQAIFVGNKFVANSTVNWNKLIQYELPICATVMQSQFKDGPVCLSSIVIGQGPGYIFEQSFRTTSTPGPFWQTRAKTKDPYNDLSGTGDLPVNNFKSLPTMVKDLPPVLYHTIAGRGGQGVAPPHPNLFSVFYEFVPCTD